MRIRDTKGRDGDHGLVQWNMKSLQVWDMLDGKVVRHSGKHCASQRSSLLYIDNEHHSLKDFTEVLQGVLAQRE